MFRNHARKIVFALSLFAAVGSMLPGANPAAAATIPASDSAADVRFELEVAQPKPVLVAAPRMSVYPLLVTRNGRITDYVFRIQADAATLKNVTVVTGSGINVSSNDQHWGNSPAQTVQLGTFSAPNYRDVHVTCNPQAGTYCSAGWVNVTTSNGLAINAANDADGNK